MLANGNAWRSVLREGQIKGNRGGGGTDINHGGSTDHFNSKMEKKKGC